MGLFTTSEQGNFASQVFGRLLGFFFTVKREVTKDGSEQVHDKHGQDGDVGNVLHTLLGSTDVKVN